MQVSTNAHRIVKITIREHGRSGGHVWREVILTDKDGHNWNVTAFAPDTVLEIPVYFERDTDG